MGAKSIETFFLNTLLKVCIGGVCVVLLADLILFPEDRLSLLIDAVILGSCSVAYLARKRFPNGSVLIVAGIVIAAMLLQCIMVPVNTTTSLSVILVVGFIFSVMFRGRMMYALHAITFLSIIVIFVVQYINPEVRFSEALADLVTVAITYSILYFILTYATAVLKSAYDKLYLSLEASHLELHDKNREIVLRNDALVKTQADLNELNSHLEDIIYERTARIQLQNEVLVKYSYTNAHQLRGPVARLLGLANISRIDPGTDLKEIIFRMEKQAIEIDEVIKKINQDIEMNTDDEDVDWSSKTA